jgi:hypothetical protein
MLRQNLHEADRKITRLSSYLKPGSRRQNDLMWLEELVYYATRESAEMREDLIGEGRGGTERAQAILQQMLDEAIEWKASIEQEHDRVIEDPLLNYESIAQSLENRGPKLYEQKSRHGAQSALEMARDLIAFPRRATKSRAGKTRCRHGSGRVWRRTLRHSYGTGSAHCRERCAAPGRTTSACSMSPSRWCSRTSRRP